VVRCRPGTQVPQASWVPDQRCTVRLRFTLRRIRDTFRAALWRGSACERAELRQIDIGAAQQHADPLAGGRPVAAGEQRGEGGGAARLAGDAQLVPQQPLRRADRIVGDERHPIDRLAREREDEIAGAARAERIRREYYDRWMRNPIRVVPTTKMPSFADSEGKTSLRDILEGDAGKQFDAIWNYLLVGRKIEHPEQ